MYVSCYSFMPRSRSLDICVSYISPVQPALLFSGAVPKPLATEEVVVNVRSDGILVSYCYFLFPVTDKRKLSDLNNNNLLSYSFEDQKSEMDPMG